MEYEKFAELRQGLQEAIDHVRSSPPNTRVLAAGAPACYMQPHSPAPCPVLIVGGVTVEIKDKRIAAQWSHWLTDYALS